MNYLICGPPASGKTSYIKERMKSGDLIVDIDLIYQAITGLSMYEKPVSLLDLVFDIRNFLIGKIRQSTRSEGDARWYNAWVIAGAPKRQQRYRLASQMDPCKVVVLEVDANECIRRIANDPRRADSWEHWQEIIRRWWREYEPDEDDAVVENRQDASVVA